MSLNRTEFLLCREAKGEFFVGAPPKTEQAKKERDQMEAAFTAGWTMGYRKGLRRARQAYEERKAQVARDAPIYEGQKDD